MDYNLIRYLPGLATVSGQEQIYNIILEKAYASSNYTDKKHLNLIFYWQQTHTLITVV